MKTLVLLSLTALHLCCVLRISTGAILTEEMLNNQILKYIKASDIKNFPNVLTKNDEALENGNIAGKIMKDIEDLLSSLQFGEYDGNDDNSYNASVGTTCNWGENSFKCCQEFDLTGNTCLVAKFVGDDINVFVQIGGKMVWVKTMSYKNTLESMFRDISKLISGNAHFDVVEQSEILTEEKTTSDNFVAMSRSSDDVSTTSCSWDGNTGHCCKYISILKRKISFCVDIKIYNQQHVEISISIVSIIIWKGNINIDTKQLEACHNKGVLKLCIAMKDLHLSRHNIGACFYAYGYLGWFKEEFRLFCFNKSF